MPLVLAAAGPVLAAGLPRPACSGTVPVRSALLLAGSLVLAALSWVAALLAGFFVGGPVGAFVTWMWFGAVHGVPAVAVGDPGPAGPDPRDAAPERGPG